MVNSILYSDFFLNANVIDSALGLESWVCNTLIYIFKCDYHGSSWYESFSNIPSPCIFEFPNFLPSFSECLPMIECSLTSHFSKYFCMGLGHLFLSLHLTWFIYYLPSLFPLWGYVVRHSCISSLWRFLGLGYHNWPTHTTWHLPYLFGKWLWLALCHTV